MNTKFSRWTVAAVSVLLCCLMLLQVPICAAESALAFGRGDGTDQSLSPSALTELLLDPSEASLTNGERAALDALSEAALIYNDHIPDSVIRREYDSELGLLTVLISPYIYRATNGERVEWIPARVWVNGDEGSPSLLENGDYAAEFPSFWHSEDLEIRVEFVWQTVIIAETADGLITMPYVLGTEALKALANFEAAAEAYTRQELAHTEYLAAKARFDSAMELRLRWEADIAVYNQKKQDYDSYLRAKAEFDAKKQAYADYLVKKEAYALAEKQYYDFEAFRAKHVELYNRYELYLQGLEGALQRLSIMESMFTYDSHFWQFYPGVMGSTVDSVLEQAHLLETTLLVERKYIDNAKNATIAVRPLLKGYSDLRGAAYKNELERYRALFTYYSENYESIRDQIILLYESLYAIYSNSGVSAAMNTHPETKPKVAHFQQFLAQLYVLRCALDDSKPTDPAWRVSPNIDLSVDQLVEAPLRVDIDSKASPWGVTLPDEEVKLPNEGFPEPVEKPVKDFEDLTDPALEGAPTPVTNPGNPPAEQAHPGEPPAEVSPPEGEKPEAPALSQAERTLAEELRAGTLPKREARGEDCTIALRKTVSCIRSITNRKTVTFYGVDGTPMETVTVDYGAAAPQPDMSLSDDERYTYVFLGWVRYGEPNTAPLVSLQSVTEDLSLSPVYRRTLKLYEVVWEVRGARKTEYYPYGETPVCPISTVWESESMIHTFLGWSQPISPVTGSAVYVAQYESALKQFTVVWIVGDQSAETVVAYGEMPVCPISTDRQPDSYVYTFLSWNRIPQPVTADITYEAIYSKQVLGVYRNGDPCSVQHTEKEVILCMEEDIVDFRGASEYAVSLGKNLTFRRGEFTITYTPAQQTQLIADLCCQLEWRMWEADTPGAVIFVLKYLSSAGRELNISRAFAVETKVTLREGMFPMVYRILGGVQSEAPMDRYADGSVWIPVPQNMQMLFRVEHRLQYSDPTENSNLTALPQSAPVGGIVELNANCTFGYEIVGAVLRLSNGETLHVEGRFFEMPDCAASVEVLVEQIIYHVTFVDENGGVLAEYDVPFGERIPLPADPVKAEDENYYYRFEGWSPYALNAAGENRSPVHTATFSREAKEKVTIGGEQATDRFLTLVVPLVSVIVVLFGVTVALCIHYRAWLMPRLRFAASRAWKTIRRGAAWLWSRLGAGAVRLCALVRSWIRKDGE